MKTREIFTSKWGWAGAVIGLLWPLYNTYVCGLYNFDFVCSGAREVPIIGNLIVIIIGFVLGLILEKLWEKFK